MRAHVVIGLESESSHQWNILQSHSVVEQTGGNSRVKSEVQCGGTELVVVVVEDRPDNQLTSDRLSWR